MKDRIKKLAVKHEKRKQELAERIELCRKYRKDIVLFANSLREQYNKGLIDELDYRQKLYSQLNGREPEEWIRYYDNHIETCKREMNRASENAEIWLKNLAVVAVLIAVMLCGTFLGKYIPTGFTVLDDAEVFAGRENYTIGEMAHIFVTPPGIDYGIEVYGPDNELYAVSLDFPIEKEGLYNVKAVLRQDRITRELTAQFRGVEEATEVIEESPEIGGNISENMTFEPVTGSMIENQTDNQTEIDITITKLQPDMTNAMVDAGEDGTAPAETPISEEIISEPAGAVPLPIKKVNVDFTGNDMEESYEGEEGNNVPVLKMEKEDIKIKIKGTERSRIKNAWFRDGIIHVDSTPIDEATISIPHPALEGIMSTPDLYAKTDAESEFRIASPYVKNNKAFNKVRITPTHYEFDVEHFSSYTLSNSTGFMTLSACLKYINNTANDCVINAEGEYTIHTWQINASDAGFNKSGLVLAMDFDLNHTFDNIPDMSDNHYNGSSDEFGAWAGGGAWQGGKIGNALYMDGRNDYVAGISTGYIENITIAAWVKVRELNAFNLIVRSNTALGYLAVNDTNYVVFTYVNQSTKGVPCISSVTLDTNWHHVAVTASNKTGEINIYIDGVNSTGTCTTPATDTNYFKSTNNWITSIGGAKASNMTVDELRMWNYTLSPAEISELYTSENSGQYLDTMNRVGLMREMHLNESSGTNVEDTSGQGDNATLTNYFRPLWNTSGYYGAAYDFDNTNNNAIYFNRTIMSGSTVSYGGWFKFDNINNCGGGTCFMLSQGDVSSIAFMLYTAYNAGTLTSSLICNDGASYTAEGIFTPTLDTWYDIFCVHNGTGMCLWVNGQNMDCVASTESAPSQDFFIGWWFNGTLDQVMVWNRSLSKTEMEQHYAGGIGKYNLSGDGITIADGNISLNCNGSTLIGDGTEGDYGIYHLRTGGTEGNISIRDCNIEGFGKNFYLDGYVDSVDDEDIQLYNCTSREGTEAISDYFVFGNYTIINFTATNENAVTISSSRNVTTDNMNIINSTSLNIGSCTMCTFSSVNVTSNPDATIAVDIPDCTDTIFQNSYVKAQKATAIKVYQSVGNSLRTILRNLTIEDSQTGIDISAANSWLHNNTIRNTTAQAIRYIVASGNGLINITNNTIISAGNTTGVHKASISPQRYDSINFSSCIIWSDQAGNRVSITSEAIIPYATGLNNFSMWLYMDNDTAPIFGCGNSANITLFVDRRYSFTCGQVAAAYNGSCPLVWQNAFNGTGAANYTWDTNVNSTTIEGYTAPPYLRYDNSTVQAVFPLELITGNNPANVSGNTIEITDGRANVYSMNLSGYSTVEGDAINAWLNNFYTSPPINSSGTVNYCFEGEGNFYWENITAVPTGDCGQSNVTYPKGWLRYNSTNPYTANWTKQSSMKTVTYEVFANKTTGGRTMLGSTTDLNIVIDGSLLSSGNYTVFLIPWVSGSRINATNREGGNFTINAVPSNVTLLSPTNNNMTVFNRTVTFNWTAATDDDGDILTYVLNITHASCPNILIGGITGTGYSLTQNLCLDSVYNWTVYASDSYDNSTGRNIWGFTVASSLIMTLINNSVNFTDVVINEEYNTSYDGAPATPLVLQNDGNTEADVVTFSANKSLWNDVGLNTSYFQYKANNRTTEPGSFNWAGSITEWANVTNTSILNSSLIADLNWTDFNDTAEIDIRIKVPPAEPAGPKYTNVFITGAMTG